MSDEMLTPAQIAARTQLSENAVYRAIEAGELVATKLRGRLRVEPDDFEAWKLANRVTPKARERRPDPMLEPAKTARPVASGGSFRGQLRGLRGGANAA